jgi:uncharacterized membrane protein YjgN (DUF898 family)
MSFTGYAPATPTYGMAPGTRLQCDFALTDILGVAIVWIILSIVTFGIALLFFPYYFQRMLLNRTVVVDAGGHRLGGFRSDIGFADMLGHMILWVLLVIVTLGIAYIFYVFRAQAFVISRTILVP